MKKHANQESEMIADTDCVCIESQIPERKKKPFLIYTGDPPPRIQCEKAKLTTGEDNYTASIYHHVIFHSLLPTWHVKLKKKLCQSKRR